MCKKISVEKPLINSQKIKSIDQAVNDNFNNGNMSLVSDTTVQLSTSVLDPYPIYCIVLYFLGTIIEIRWLGFRYATPAHIMSCFDIVSNWT